MEPLLADSSTFDPTSDTPWVFPSYSIMTEDSFLEWLVYEVFLAQLIGFKICTSLVTNDAGLTGKCTNESFCYS